MRDTIQIAVQKFIDANQDKLVNKEVILLGTAALSLIGVVSFEDESDIDILLQNYTPFTVNVSNRIFDFVRYDLTMLDSGYMGRTKLAFEYENVLVKYLSLEDVITTLISGYQKLKHKDTLKIIFDSGYVNFSRLESYLNNVRENTYLPVRHNVFKRNFNKFLDDYRFASKVAYME